MRYEPLHVGDLVCIRGHERKIGVIIGLFKKKNTYYVYWLDSTITHVLPLGVLKKIFYEPDI